MQLANCGRQFGLFGRIAAKALVDQLASAGDFVRCDKTLLDLVVGRPRRMFDEVEARFQFLVEGHNWLHVCQIPLLRGGADGPRGKANRTTSLPTAIGLVRPINAKKPLADPLQVRQRL